MIRQHHGGFALHGQRTWRRSEPCEAAAGFQIPGRASQREADLIHGYLTPNIPFVREDVLLYEDMESVDEDLTKPSQQFPLVLAPKLREVSIGTKHRLLNQVRRADSSPQLLVNLRLSQQMQIVAIRVQELAQPVVGPLPCFGN